MGQLARALACRRTRDNELRRSGVPSRDVARALWNFSWKWLPGREALRDETLIDACIDLFSRDYGMWGRGGPRPGEPVTITRAHLARLLSPEAAHVVCAFDGELLVGYAVILRFEGSPERRVAWIAQLVVRETYRQSRVATTLLFSAWQFSDYQVWGLITANPFAVRALETATRRPCRSKTILDNGPAVLGDLAVYLDYVPPAFVERDGTPCPCVGTDFHLDLSGLDRMKERAARGNRPWNLGSIAEGQEWFAATFSSQAPSVARGEYLEELLEGVDSIWVRAYEGMTLDSEHSWHRHGVAEVDWILARAELPIPARVLDAGCGDGRHASALAARGLSVTGVDISDRLLSRAREVAGATDDGIEFQHADLRALGSLPTGPFDLVLCLYDVLGSSADPTDDTLILANIRSVIAPDGFMFLSVMNAASTLPFLPPEHRPASEEEFVTALEGLAPSREMEQTGRVFDPRFIVHFNGRFYRKEQFDLASNLPPGEIVVRDRRFLVDDVVVLVEGAGFRVEEVAGVRAGAWREPLDPSSNEAKEILVVARPCQ